MITLQRIHSIVQHERTHTPSSINKCEIEPFKVQISEIKAIVCVCFFYKQELLYVAVSEIQ